MAPVGSGFRMPVEFAVAGYRFGHSMIRDRYWVNFNFINATLGQVFEFSRTPRLPVFSNWVVDFNAFFDTGVAVPVNNKARKIDSFIANGLESLPGPPGLMAILAARNLRRGLARGLPSGQGMAHSFGIPPMTTPQLTSGLPPNEVALLNANGRLLLKKTPLWYYVLREAAVLGAGNQLGPVGGRIVAQTFIRILKRDAASYLNVPGGFTHPPIGRARQLHCLRPVDLRRGDPALEFAVGRIIGWSNDPGLRGDRNPGRHVAAESASHTGIIVFRRSVQTSE